MEFVSASSTLAQLFMQRSFLLLLAPKNYHSLPLKSQVVKFFHQLAQYWEELDVFFILGVYEKFDKVFFLFLFIFFCGVGLGRGMQINNINFNVSAEW